ncbi:uncharacterized protein LOC135392281 [Ornithodoros turicata]|uniref:uncharacterized protein LOC135392281 n=1 Tax=Ornithodoros turicata TaxID=34597 RepID=UPI003138EA3F
MRCCCVPMCSSSTRKRDPGVSFHKVPADLELREKWLKLIARKNWEPSSTCNSSVVCSKHFVVSDFKENTRLRLLKKGAVPSVFPGYPLYMTPKAPHVRREPESRKRAMTAYVDEATGKDARVAQKAKDNCDERLLITEEPPAQPVGQEPTSDSFARSDRGTCSHLNHLKSTPVFAKRSFSTQTEKANFTAFIERRKWRAKERSLRQQISRLKESLRKHQEELRQLKADFSVDAFLDVVTEAQQNDIRATFVPNQVVNYKRKRPTWSELTVRYCVVLRNLSIKAYEYVRCEELLRLPCRNTLQKYIGTSIGEVGFSPLVHCRLDIELQSLAAPQSKVCSLVNDEMHVRQRLEYNKQRDAFIRDVTMGKELGHLTPAEHVTTLANSLLCFLLCGLADRFKIPVAYFFTKACTAPDLAQAIVYVIKRTAGVQNCQVGYGQPQDQCCRH